MEIATDTEHDARASQDDVRTTDEPETLESPSLHVVAAIADATGHDPATMAPLYEAIDPDALDALFRGGAAVDGRIEFTYYGYEVSVTASGHVTLEETLGDR